jgi:DNA-binding MarR family transcriptional regulator
MTDFMFEKPDAPAERSMTISVSEGDLRAATQLLQSLLAMDHAQSAYNDVQPGDLNGIDKLAPAALSRRIFEFRRRRAEVFGKGMFGEPAWDMLLALYMEASSGPKVTVGRLSEMTDTAQTTAIRWLDYLENHGLVRREPHPTDRRAVRVELTGKGRSALDELLSGTGL